MATKTGEEGAVGMPRTSVLRSRLCTKGGAAPFVIAILFGLLSVSTASAQAYNFSILHSFGSSDGSGPKAPLIRDGSGNLYGTTPFGGTFGYGIVFELVDTSGSYNEKVLYNFTGGSDGGNPEAGLVMDASGNLFGTASGTAFELVHSADTYTEKVLHTFTGSPDGAFPYGDLVMDASGNLYGTTMAGGISSNNGTVFELVNSSGNYSEKVLYSFAGGDSADPESGLIMDGSGDLYGTTMEGGSYYNAGTVFELVNAGGSYVEKVLYAFKGGTDGLFPQANLAMDSSGNLYGTTPLGGTLGYGIVFELVDTSGSYNEKVLYNFTGGSDGGNPEAGLVMDASGNLFGTTSSGGLASGGTAFELVKSAGGYTEELLHFFSGGFVDGIFPYAGLLMDTSGNLFGTTEGGGTNLSGTVFELTPSSGSEGPPAPVVSLSVTNLSFPNQTVNTASNATPITVTNTGNAPLEITATPSISGANAADFAVTTGTTCTNGASIASGNPCTIELEFTPSTATTESAMLSIYDNAADSPQEITLTGTGIVPPPTITSTSPSQAIQGGRVSLFLIDGANFQTNASISFSGGQDITITGTSISSTQIVLNLSIAASASPGAHSVTVMNPDGQSGIFGDALNVVTVPPPPQDLYAVDGNKTVYLSWDGVQSAPEGYNVYVNGVKANSSGLVQDTSFVVDNLENGHTYELSVTAVGGGGESSAATISVRPNLFNAPAHPLHPILFLHGINASAEAWTAVTNVLTSTLGWTCGGTLAYLPQDNPNVVLPHDAFYSSNPSLPSPPACEHAFSSTGDFFTTDFGDNLANYTDDPDSTGIFRQGDEVGGFIRKIETTHKLSIVAWSMGGLAARSYMQVTDPTDAPSQISDLITLGTPHWGVDRSFYLSNVVEIELLDLAFHRNLTSVLTSVGLVNMNSGCVANGDSSDYTYDLNPFLYRLDINTPTLLPSSVRYVVVSGLAHVWPGVLSPRSDECAVSGSVVSDGVVPSTSSSLKGILPSGQQWQYLETPDVHTEGLPGTALPDDISAILCALDESCIELKVMSPVDIQVTAPNGFTISNDSTSMPGADYRSVVNAEGHEIATVLIPFPEAGQYAIAVTPKPGAQPTDTFTITMTQDGVTTTLADHMQIQSIPPDGFHIMTSGWVPIDIKPGGYPNSINAGSNGTIPVAVLSTPWFDAPSEVMTSSLRFGRDSTEASLASCGSEDVNGDGLPDLVCHFYTQQTGFRQGDKQGILTGKMVTGQLIRGADTVNIVQ